jgi:hypothetical protein
MQTYFFFKKFFLSYTRFAFHSKNSQINYTVKYLKKYEGPTNKFKKNYEFFLKFSDIIKGLISPTIKTNRNKINGIDIKMYFGKCILDLK